MDSTGKIILGVILIWLSICLLGYLGYTYGLSIYLLLPIILFVPGIAFLETGVAAYEKASERNNNNA